MYIHIGSKTIISDRKLIGIFNSETIRLSELNEWLTEQLTKEDKSIAIDEDNNITTSIVSPYTVVKRTLQEKDFVWRRDNEQGL